MAPSLLIQGRTFLKRVWQLAKPYWQSEEKLRAWSLLVAIVSISLFIVYLSVVLNDWNRQFFNAIQEKDSQAFFSLLVRFCGIAAVFILVAVVRVYLRQMLEMRWRIWLTRQYLGEWLGNQVYYRLEQDARGTDNPDQRIADDLRSFTSTTLALTLDLLQQVVTLVSFVVILWNVSGAIEFEWAGRQWVIPGYMVWAALLYAIVGSVFVYHVGRPLIGLNFRQERYEADLRFSLVRMREHAEGIALYRGERAERANLEERVEGIRTNWWHIMRATMRLNFLTNGYSQIAVVFPYFVAAPRYFSGAIQLGTLTQIADAFGTVQSSMSWFVQSYSSLASWKASVDRLLTFHHALVSANDEAQNAPPIKHSAGTTRVLSANDLQLALPNGRSLLTQATLRVEPGERVLIQGPSGSGKSTIFRAIAGIWSYGKGEITIPANARVMFLPQKPYLPIGTLRAAVAYPAEAHTIEPAEIEVALRAVGMELFVDRLDESRNWSMTLSGGEQQKVAIARALLAKPDWLFLDEATASLDEPTEARLYQLMNEQLPGTALISIAHRSQVAAYHQRRVELSQGRLMTA